MPNGWGGADPTASTDNNGYELGVEYIANSDLTISAVRLWGGPADVSVASRKARIWSATGTLLGAANLPNVLTSGWATYNLVATVTRPAGSRFVVSYTTGGLYGQVVHGLDTAVNSADNNVTAVAFSNGTNGNGVFNTTQTNFPTTPSSTHTFYGNDFVYSLGIAGPAITNLAITTAGAVATATISATDSGAGLAGAVYKYDWGDGTTPTVSSLNTASHTYSSNGTYAVLVSVTDLNSLSAFAAQPVTIAVFVAGFDANGLTNSLVTMAEKSGLFAVVTGHEIIQPPPAGMIAAVWLQTIGPARKFSGLNSTAGLVVFTLRIYMPMITGALDTVDPQMATAAAGMIGTLTAGYTLGGSVIEVDVLGSNGKPLSADAGYLKDQPTRIMDINIPLVVDNVWGQAP
jgi:hypothetical protein